MFEMCAYTHWTYLIGLICIDPLPMTGNRQGKVITNKSERRGETGLVVKVMT